MKQRSIASPCTIEGIGLHSGKACRITLSPAAEGSGIQFALTSEKPYRLSPEILSHSKLCSGVALGKHTLYTIEHLLAAIYGLGIDNLLINSSSTEIPILDGSAKMWVAALMNAKVIEQDVPKTIYTVKNEIELVQGKSRLLVKPASSLIVTASIDFNHPLIGKQQTTYRHSTTNFNRLCSARTFGFIKDQKNLHEAGYALGATTDNCLIFTQDGLYNHQSLQQPIEPLNHKILDFLGDLAVFNVNLIAQFDLIRPNHSLTQRLLKTLAQDKHWLTLDENSIY